MAWRHRAQTGHSDTVATVCLATAPLFMCILCLDNISLHLPYSAGYWPRWLPWRMDAPVLNLVLVACLDLLLASDGLGRINWRALF